MHLSLVATLAILALGVETAHGRVPAPFDSAGFNNEEALQSAPVNNKEALQSAPFNNEEALQSAPFNNEEALQDKHGYFGNVGPASWGGKCQTGTMQSPVNLVDNKDWLRLIPIEESALKLNWTSNKPVPIFGKKEGIEKHPKTVYFTETNPARKVDDVSKAAVEFHRTDPFFSRVNKTNFPMLQFHMHQPSEHFIKGVNMPIEMHFVHALGDKKVVVSVMFDLADSEEDKMSSGAVLMDEILLSLPKEYQMANYLQPKSLAMIQKHIMKSGSKIWTYMGSLTTYPCTEGVRFYVVNEPMLMSVSAYKRLRELIGFNSRLPVERKELSVEGKKSAVQTLPVEEKATNAY